MCNLVLGQSLYSTWLESMRTKEKCQACWFLFVIPALQRKRQWIPGQSPSLTGRLQTMKYFLYSRQRLSWHWVSFGLRVNFTKREKNTKKGCNPHGRAGLPNRYKALGSNHSMWERWVETKYRSTVNCSVISYWLELKKIRLNYNISKFE